jgi:hypothetical protein
MYSNHEAIRADSQPLRVPCSVAAAFLAVEDDARAKVRLHGNSMTAARWADFANETRRRHNAHVESCDQCLAAESEY